MLDLKIVTLFFGKRIYQTQVKHFIELFIYLFFSSTMVPQSWMHGDGWLLKGQNCALLNWPWKITQIQEGSLDLKWWWKKGQNQNPSNKTLGLPTMKGPKKGSPTPPSKKKSIPDLKKFSIKNWAKITLYIPSEFIFSSSGNLELWGQPLGLLSCKKNCLVNLQGRVNVLFFCFF